MTLSNKIIIAIASILIVLSLGFIIKLEYDLNAKQAELNHSIIETKQLADGISRSQSQYVSKDDLNKFGDDLKLNLDIIKKDMASLHANLEGINNILVLTPGYHQSGLGSSSSVHLPGTSNTSIPLVDRWGYLTSQQFLDLNEPMADGKPAVPWGRVGFSANLEKPWDLNVFPRSYSVSTVLATDASNKHTVYNKFTITSQGKTYEIPIQSSKFEETLPQSQFYFNPRIYLGLSTGVIFSPSAVPAPKAEATVSAQVFLGEYGKVKSNPEFALGGIGLAIETQSVRPAVILTPGSWNIGHHLPLVNNLHIAPSVTVDSKGHLGVLGGIFVGL